MSTRSAHLGLWYASAARAPIRQQAYIYSKVKTSPPNLGGLSPLIITLTSGFRRPSPRSPPLGLPQLAEWTPPAPCARAPRAVPLLPAGVPHQHAKLCFPASEKQIGHVWAASRTYPIQLNWTDSRPRARCYQLRGLPPVGSECVCPQFNSAFFTTRGSAMPSAMYLPVHIPYKVSQESLEAQSGKVELPSNLDHPTILYAMKCPMIRLQRAVQKGQTTQPVDGFLQCAPFLCLLRSLARSRLRKYSPLLGRVVPIHKRKSARTDGLLIYQVNGAARSPIGRQ